MAHFRPKIRKLCVVHTYANMDEILAATIKVEKVLGEIEEAPFEPLKDERDEKTNTRESSIERQIHVLNETLMKFFKRSVGKEIIPFGDLGNSNVCQLCNMVGHGAFACSKLSDRPECDACERGHRTKNCGLKCSYCFGLGHTKKTLKHGLIVVSTGNIQSWDLQILRILFGYHCGIQANTRYSPYMNMTNMIPRLTIDNRLNNLTHIVEDRIVHKEMALHMVFKMKLVGQLHESLLQIDPLEEAARVHIFTIVRVDRGAKRFRECQVD